MINLQDTTTRDEF
jgi:hypothetical protein